MSRISPMSLPHAQGMTKGLFASARSRYGTVPNALRVLGHSEAALSAFLNLSGGLATGVLSARVREGIALVVAETNSCSYCLSWHAQSATWAGLTEDEIAQARRAISADPKFSALLKFARLLVLLRGQVSASDIETVRQAGASEAEIVEVVAHVALSTFSNYLNIAADTTVDFPLLMPGIYGPDPRRGSRVA